MSFFTKDSYTEEDIDQLITDGIEEAFNLDYKRAESLDKSDKKKGEIAKDVSAFSNSSGGIIVYGIEEINHKPMTKTYIDGNVFTKEWLENIIHSNVHRRIEGLRIFPVRCGNNELTKSIYVVKIPESQDTPHFCVPMHRFYKRYNFKSEPMEEYEIRALYSKQKQSDLRIEELKTTATPKMLIAQKPKEVIMHLDFLIKNVGNIKDSDYNLELYIHRAIYVFSNTIHANPIAALPTKDEGDYVVVSVSSTSTIHPGEIKPHFKCWFSFNKKTFQYLQTPFKTKLYFSNRCVEDEFNLQERFNKGYKQMDISDFADI